MTPRQMKRARRRAIAAGTAVALGAAPAAASADSLVTNTNDSGPGSLRQAVIDSNAEVDPDTVTFAPNVAGTITLSSRIVATRTTTIDGPGADVLTVVSPANGIFLLNDFSAGSSTLEVEGLTLRGSISGGGSAGGAIAVGGRSGGLTVRNCTITGSTSANEGGAIDTRQTPVTVIDSRLTGNRADLSGGAINARDSAVTIIGSTIADNSTFVGGAISLSESADAAQSALTVIGSRITGNRAESEGGGISVGSADGPTTIRRSTVSGNSAGTGAGLYFGYGEALTIDSSTFSANNSSGEGGGMFIYAPGGPTTITNTTVSGNLATLKGAGIYSFSYFDKPVRILNSTIAQNSGAGTGGGIFQFGYDGQGAGYEGLDEITLSSTIVANNFQNTGPDLAQGPNVSAASSFELDHSLIGSTAGGARITEAAPGSNLLDVGLVELSPLADNGGPTQTLLPALGGPATDAGVANGLAADGRGLARIVDQPLTPSASSSDGTDIGAVELADDEISGAGTKAKKKQGQKGKKIVVAVKAKAAEAVTVTASGTVKLGKKKLTLTKPTAQTGAGEAVTLKLKPKGKKATKQIAKALAQGKKAKANVSVAFTDAAGNSDLKSAKVTLSGKGKK